VALIEVQGEVDAFIDDLVAQAPPLARIDGIESERCAIAAERMAAHNAEQTLGAFSRHDEKLNTIQYGYSPKGQHSTTSGDMDFVGPI